MSVSIWLDRSNSYPQKSYDVVIVGAGIAGLSTAFWLKKEQPSLKIAIIEKRRLGAGATGRNAGFITCGSVEHFSRMVIRYGLELAKEIWQFSEENLRLLKEHLSPNLQRHGFVQSGSFSLAASDTEFAELKTTAHLMNTAGISTEILNPRQIQSRLRANGFAGGIKYLDDATIHPIQLLNELASRVDCEIIEDCEFMDCSPSGPDLAVRTDRHHFICSTVILAGNGYLPTFDPFFQGKVFPTRGQILITEPVPRFMEGPCYANFVLDYFRQLPSGEVLIGGFRQLEKETEIGYSDHITIGIQQALHAFLERHIPHISQAKVTHRWSGVMGFSVDGQPLVGSLPQQPLIFYIGGFTGHGLGLAFHCAKVLVDLIYGRKVPNFLSAKRL